MGAYLGVYRPIQIVSAPVGGPPVCALLPGARSTGDLTDLGGTGYIAGIVQIDANPDYPVSRRVTLLHERDGRVVRQMWSDPVTGAYRFDGLNPSYTYIVIGHDHTRVYNAEILAGIKPLLP